MPCLCAPTTHAGSFRCRLHRSQQAWGGRPMPCKPEEIEEDLDVPADDASEIQSSPSVVIEPSFVSGGSPPASATTSSTAGSPPGGTSRLKRMVTFSDEPEVLNASTNKDQMHNMKMATGTRGSYASAPGERPSVFRRLKNGHSTTKMYSDSAFW